MGRSLSSSGIYRLALYSRYISGMDKADYDYVSSQELADAIGNTAAQVRKDLTCYGSLGKPGKGYEIGKLKAMLTRVFGKDKVRNVILVGAGNLGMALISYRGFQLQQFRIAAAFDRDTKRIGRYVEDVLIRDIRDLRSVLANIDADMAIVAVPAQSVQEVVDQLASAGIKAILNFAPANRLKVPESVRAQSVDMSVELDRLHYLLRN